MLKDGMKGGNIVIFSKNYVTDIPVLDNIFIQYKQTLKGNTLRIQM